jgi:hypothetical protein
MPDANSRRRRYTFFSNGRGDPALTHLEGETCVILEPTTPYHGHSQTMSVSRVRFENGFECEVPDSYLFEAGGHASW